ncbi:hypothetical protein COHA_004149 [Chlorella ohadii]|uniref:acetyl-CoA C-acyltransferase n=1 Tax=Chlorella ohadii TaxID=2649997 RepID=A0AAD5DTZ8_9CHLO|nr:hypothetical protein COHA_004149 [Chlorella ohadii]
MLWQRAGVSLPCRMAMFLAGFPVSVPVHTVNRQCCSGLQAVAQVAAAIRGGLITVGIAGGVESMSTNPMPAKNWQEPVNPRLAGNQGALDCLLPMGIAASENVAARFGVSRQEQDEFAAASHRKAAAAQAAGKFQQEIVPVPTLLKDASTGEERQVVLDRDDGIRPGTTPASLAQLKPAFKQGGSTTAGNSSQMSDGAAALMLMTRSEAARRGLPVLGVFKSFAAVGVPPAILGIGPTVAIPAALEKAGIGPEDVAVYEINEAFASQAAYCVRCLGLDPAKVNPNGGAIALGHPLGCTGARQVVTLLHELQRRGRTARFGVVSMCIGSGMGAAAVFERGDGADAMPRRPMFTQRTGLSCDAAVN